MANRLRDRTAMVNFCMELAFRDGIVCGGHREPGPHHR
jgi:hypothetical protein